MKRKNLLILLIFFILPLGLFSQGTSKDTDYLKKLERDLSEEEKFLEDIVENLISKGNKEFVETLIYRMGYEKAKEKTPKVFFPLQFGGGQMVSGGLGIHIYNRQFYIYFSGGYTTYGKYKDYSASFVTEVKIVDLYFYKRNRIDFLVGSNISFFTEPGVFIASVAFKQVYYIQDWFLNFYTVFNLYFDKSDPIYQIGLGVNFYPFN